MQKLKISFPRVISKFINGHEQDEKADMKKQIFSV